MKNFSPRDCLEAVDLKAFLITARITTGSQDNAKRRVGREVNRLLVEVSVDCCEHEFNQVRG